MTAAMSEPRRCGRPTKSGAPCKQQLYVNEFRFATACRTHSTAHEIELAEAQYAAYHLGRREQREWTDEAHRGYIARLERQIENMRKRIDGENRRFETPNGDQIVVIDDHLTYCWAGQPLLVVGDRVLLPANWVSELHHGHGPHSGTVTALGSTYSGHLSAVIRRVSNTELSLSTAE